MISRSVALVKGRGAVVAVACFEVAGPLPRTSSRPAAIAPHPENEQPNVSHQCKNIMI